MRTVAVTLLSVFALLGCGPEVPAGEGFDGGPEGSCTVEETAEGVVISCPDGTVATLNDGTSEPCSVAETDGGTLVTCPDGTETLIPEAEPCTVEQGDGGAIVTCPDGTETVLPDAPDVEMVEEPAGDNCPYGGTAVLVGGEVEGYVCDGNGFPECDVAVGNFTVTNSRDVDMLAGCRVIDGSLRIGQGMMASLTPGLLSLEEVTNGLRVDSTYLESLEGLENVRWVGGDLSLTVNHHLNDISALSNVSHVGGFSTGTGNLLLTDCELLTFFEGIPEPGLGVTVENNAPCN